jgi:hypothetical protein
MVQSAYLNPSGKPALQESIVGFLDLLGFSQHVMAAQTEDESQRLLDKIVEGIADSRHFVRRELSVAADTNPAGWAVKFFSDNLVLGYAQGESTATAVSAAWFVVRCAQRYQLRMTQNGLFLRGGLTIGPVCMTDEIIFGRALIDCYQLESHVAIVPRVILSEELSQLLTADFSTGNPAGKGDFSELICRDIDGWWFVNYLQAACHGSNVEWGMIERHKQSLLDSLSSTTRHDVLPKFGWSCRYHNLFCHWHRDWAGYSNQFRIDRLDESSTIHRLSDLRNNK